MDGNYVGTEGTDIAGSIRGPRGKSLLLFFCIIMFFKTLISWLLKIIITAIFVTRIQTWSSPSVWEWQVTNRWRGSVTNWRTGSRGCRRSFADLCHFIQQTNSLGVGWAVRKEQMLGNKSGNAWSNTITRVLKYCYTKVKGSNTTLRILIVWYRQTRKYRATQHWVTRP